MNGVTNMCWNKTKDAFMNLSPSESSYTARKIVVMYTKGKDMILDTMNKHTITNAVGKKQKHTIISFIESINYNVLFLYPSL